MLSSDYIVIPMKMNILLKSTLIYCLIAYNWLPIESRGGGSKRTFSSSKSQNSQNPQNLDNCVDQSNCNPDLPDQSWSSVMGATLALVAPLGVLLTFILMIKFCFINMYPKGYHERVDENHTNKSKISQEIKTREDKNGRQLHQIA